MRFLANENFPGAAVAALEAAGHDVAWVRTAAPGMIDQDVMAWAARDERILLTFVAIGSSPAKRVWPLPLLIAHATGGCSRELPSGESPSERFSQPRDERRVDLFRRIEAPRRSCVFTRKETPSPR